MGYENMPPAAKAGLLVALKNSDPKAVRALRDALYADSSVLVQGSTTVPPPLACVVEWPCQGTCLLGYLGWEDPYLRPGSAYTVEAVEQRFAEMCFKIDQELGEPAACRWLLNWWDDTPRPDALKGALIVVDEFLGSSEDVYDR